jgi:signal transduction histidine kinase
MAAMLVAQGLLFVWVVSRSGPTLPGQPPDRFAQSVALDLAEEMERNPSVEIGAYIREQFGRDAHPFFVMLADGRVFENGGPFPDPLLRMARLRIRRVGPPPPAGPDRPFEPPPSFGRGGQGAGRPGFRPARPVPIIVGGQLAGVVVVSPQAPFRFLLSRYAPTLGVVALGALVVGAVLAAVMIFGPPRRRLKAVEEAVRKLGAGDLTARAPDSGGDEVAAVAGAFNAMAKDLAARADALAASDQARRNLLADVSHELTTPVTAMRGYLETLTMPEFAGDEATRARYLGIVRDELARLERIIGDLLDLARIEGGGGTLRVERVSVEALFDRVRARHERALHEAELTLVTSIQPGAAWVEGDRDRLEQVLQNLSANAIRYATKGTAIELTAETRGATVTLRVTDHGPGIPPDHIDRVFDRFYKAEASRAGGPPGTAAGGSGLGLSIVKAIIERHGGRVSVHSRPGETVFEIGELKSTPGPPVES